MNNAKSLRIKCKREKIEKHDQDNELLQEVFLLYLLNPFCSIELIKPSNRIKTIPYMYRINKILFTHEDMNFTKTVENILFQIVESEVANGLQREKAKRHSETNRISVTINLLIDICLEFGYFFNFKKSRKPIKTLRFDRIKEVYVNNILYMNNDDVVTKSHMILSYLQQMYDDEQIVMLSKNCFQEF
ncbi:TATA-binding protein-associated phosphoprotein [Entamoeba marina]